MTSISRPASPSAGRRTDATDWVHVTATARNLRAAYIGGLLRNALNAFTPDAGRTR